MRKRTLVMAVLDGWGIGTNDSTNPIYLAKPEQINFIKQTYPAGTLKASGIAVGLPWGSDGDSEVGHLTLGAGKVLYQYLPRISLSIKDKTFFENKEFLNAAAHSKKNNSNLHLVGLISEGNVHSSLDHLRALFEFTKNQGVPNFYLHLFTDGRDSGPKKAKEIIKTLPREQIASISGRYFAMDRDLHWERNKRVYDAMTGLVQSQEVADFNTFLDSFYQKGMTDETISPPISRLKNFIPLIIPIGAIGAS